MRRNCIVLSVGALFTVGHGTVSADPLTVSWADLRTNRPAHCAAFLDNYRAQSKCKQQAASARLLSSRYEACAPGTSNLDGQTVRIAGYAHPLEFEFRDVKTFLLIPPLRQDCRHPPPPLPDQVISVTFPEGFDVTADPVWVIGTLRHERNKSHLATASYTLTATSVINASIPDVTAGD